MVSGVEDPANWERRRKRRIFWLRLVASLVALPTTFFVEFLLLLGLGGRAALAAFTSGLATPAKMKAACAVRDAAQCHVVPSPWLSTGLIVLPLIGAVATAWFAKKGAAQALDDRLFARLDLGLFDPLPPSREAAGATLPLPWVLEATGPRAELWEKLATFTTGSDFSKGEARFAWTMLTGLPGIGKSRLAEEFARSLANPAHPDRKRTRLRFLQRLGRVVPFMRTRPADLWHVGSVPNRAIAPGWHPSRATLLVLDDPTPGESEDRVRDLRGRCDEYRFPVRLLIVNQSRATHDLREAEIDRLDPLGSRSGFTREAVGDILIALSEEPLEQQPWGRAIRSLLKPDAALGLVMEMTRGNPFLVELCIDWAREQAISAGETRPTRDLRDRIVEALSNLKADDLIRGRAKRVIGALEVAGIGDGQPAQFQAIAAATLVGPRARRRPIVKMLEAADLPQGERLRYIVPGDTAFDALDELPCIRPHLIGDAAVRLMLEPEGRVARPDDRRAAIKRVVDAGFAASPSGWIRARKRFGERAGMVAEALRHLPTIVPDAPAELREEMAFAFMELGLFGRVPALEAAQALDAIISYAAPVTRPALISWLQKRLERILVNDTDARIASLTEPVPVADLSEDEGGDPFHRFIHGQGLAVIGLTLIACGQQGTARTGNGNVAAALDSMAVLLAEVGTRGEGVLTEDVANAIHDIGARSSVGFSGSADANVLASVDRILTLDSMNLSALVLGPLIDKLTLTQDQGFAVKALAIINDARQGTKRIDSSAAELEGLAKRATAAGPDVQRKCARAWNIVLARSQIDMRLDGLAAVNHVEAIAARDEFAGDPGVQFERVRAWRIDAGRHKSASARRAAVDHVEEVATRGIFASHSAIQRERAEAWRLLAASYIDDASACIPVVNRIEAIGAANRFAGDRGIQSERAMAWSILAGTLNRSDASRCQEAVDRVEAIAALDLFAVDRDIQYARAMAWRNVTYAYLGKASRCREAVDRLEAIARRDVFAADRNIQYERAVGWRYLTHALSGDAALCKEAVDRVEMIAARYTFVADGQMQAERARAWCSLAFAFIGEADRCREAVDRVEAIAAGRAFSADRDMQFERATAWRYLSGALQGDADRCRDAIDRVEAIAAREAFAVDLGIQKERVNAWSNLAFATRDDISRCRDAVARAEAIGVRAEFAADAEIREELRLARSYLRGES